MNHLDPVKIKRRSLLMLLANRLWEEEVLYSLPDDSSSAMINGNKKLPSSGETGKKRKSKSDSSQTKKRLKIDSKQESNSKSEHSTASEKVSGWLIVAICFI